PRGRARTGAEPAMHPAAPVGHGRLAAAAVGPRPGAAARGGQEVAGRRVVPESATTVGGKAGEGGSLGHGETSKGSLDFSCSLIVLMVIDMGNVVHMFSMLGAIL